MKYKKYRDDGFDSLPQVFADGGISRYEVPAQQATGLQAFQLPYNEIATALLSKQKKRDEDIAQLGLVGGLKDNIKSLDPSVPGAENDRVLHQQISNDIDNRVKSLYDIDLQTPQGKKQLYQNINDIKSMFGPNGDAYKLTERYNSYNAKQKAIADDKSLEKRPDITNYAQKSVKMGDFNSPGYNKADGYNYVAPVADKEAQDWLDGTLKSVAETTLSPAQYHDFNLKGTFNYLRELRQTDGKLYNTIVETLNSRLPKGYLDSSAQDAILNNADPKEQYNIFQRDAKGNVAVDDKTKTYKLNPNSTWGRYIEGTATGGAYAKEDIKLHGYQDNVGLYGAQHKIDNPISNFQISTQAHEQKPISGQTPTEYNNTIKDLSVSKDSLIKPYVDKFFPGLGATKSFADILALDDQTLHDAGLSREMIQADAEAYNNLDRTDNIVQQRDKNLEEKAAQSLGINYNVYKNTKDNLPELPETGLSKNEILDAINRGGSVHAKKEEGTGKLSYFTVGGPITEQEAKKLMSDYSTVKASPKTKDYFNFVSNTNKILNKKNELMNTQTAPDNTTSTNIFNNNPKLATALQSNAKEFFAKPQTFSTATFALSDPNELGGATSLIDAVKNGSINGLEDVKVGEVTFTKQAFTVNPKTGQASLAIRVPITVTGKDGKQGKPIELIYQTGSETGLNSPEIEAAVNTAPIQSAKEYFLTRQEASSAGGKYQSKDYAPFDVMYNTDDKKIQIMGLNFNEAQGLKHLNDIYDARKQGLTDAQIKESLKKNLK